uniref:Zinc finger protein 865 n=1 Tax=Periophthalmus magnuspinnatus TaxID=409849 RepID=A0A3B3ZBG0_9GOBI
MDRSKVWTKLWEPPAQMETEAPGDHYTQDYDRDYTQDYARDHSQRNDTSPTAHNPGLYSKYTCGANVEGALARTAGGGGGGGGGETRAAVREGQINDTSLTSHNSGGGKRGGRGETRATASEGQIKDTSPAALNSKCPSENVLYLGSAKVHVCVFCEKRFSTNQSLQIHIRVHTGEKPYSCPVCGKCFTQKAHLKTHIRTHTKERPYRCSICFKSFMHKVSLNLHMEKTCHTKLTPVSFNPCPDAVLSSKTDPELFVQWANSSSSPSSSSSSSPSSSPSPSSSSSPSLPFLLSSVCLYLGGGGETLECPFCQKGFTTKHNLEIHTRVHTGEKSYRCPICRSSFVRKCSLKAHARMHREGNLYRCSVCTRAFPQLSSLTQHYRTHTGEKPYSCSVCNNRFTQHHHLTEHMRTHTGERPYSCSVCGKTFARSFTLKIHHRQHKTVQDAGERLSARRASLAAQREAEAVPETNASAPGGLGHASVNAHTHREAKLYCCSVCGRTFSQLSSLTQHNRTHTGEKPYSCSVCNNRFTQQHHLTEHMRIHTGERPYSCSVFCGKTFARSFTLKIHHRQHKTVQDAGERLSARRASLAAQREAEAVPETNASAPGGLGHASVNTSTHREAKLYCCSVCGRTFSQLSSLTQHNRTHTGEKPYSCSVCNNRFTQQHHLTEHMRIHTGERPYTPAPQDTGSGSFYLFIFLYLFMYFVVLGARVTQKAKKNP